MGTTMVPKNIRVDKYDVWAFQCRVGHLNSFPRSKLTELETFIILFNFMVQVSAVSNTHEKVPAPTPTVGVSSIDRSWVLEPIRQWVL